MTGAHSRLAALWDALEAQGAVVHRIRLDTITARCPQNSSSLSTGSTRVIHSVDGLEIHRREGGH